ncbi:DUF4114 domain-containing protein [Nodosilinea sp. LEGE 06152]|uniref:DUF4114 domain-containing protein n=1 Tax=Nodosilinea sp. LEGE 06152 TaxID=2777966 RepID=UPI0018828917|nr:DUF4114 domain-containing protein [Nodosilinea sp. LEGE 06152]MBE9156747.1 DUF4114 domain-containing protein [Nodosilinea sp. LEGE 06152]
MTTFAPNCSKQIYSLASLTLLATGASFLSPAAVQALPEVTGGAVRVERNAFSLTTGELENTSNIPLPNGLIHNPREGRAQPVITNQLAPNTVNIRTNLDNINTQLQPLAPGFELDPSSVSLSTEFNLRYVPNAHAYGEGIEVTVYGPDGTEKSRSTAFVRGDRVVTGPQGTLPTQATLEVNYGVADTVELRVLHLRTNNSQPSESAIYFTREGQFAVEDLPNGGDRDFNDGDYFKLSGGEGSAVITDETQTISETISYRTEVIETPIDPLVRQEQEVVETPVGQDLVVTHTEEQRDYGQVKLTGLSAAALAHGLGARASNDEQLIYNRYAGAAQVRLGSDGGSLVGQLPPLVDNPAVPPTLVTGTLRFNPGAAVNQAGLSGTVSLTQFLHPTHREAVDMYGQVVTNPDPNGPRLVQPAGLLANTRLVGYVPGTPDQVVTGRALISINGIFELPENEAVIIAPPNPDLVGPGNAAYTHNVGGLVIERTDGSAEFVPQWTRQGHATESITLAAGEARRVIYALVPQQANQDLQLGQAYPLLVDPTAGYRVEVGGWQVIAADHHRDNFLQEATEIYAVEDTLAQQNAATVQFNGVRGLYRQEPNGELIATLSLSDPAGVDARIGNRLVTADTTVPGEPGQPGYYTTTVAAGLYARGSLSLGLGNQQDVITTATATQRIQADDVQRQTTTRFFATPRTEVETRTTEAITRVTETTNRSGSAAFNIDSNGLLNNVQINVAPDQVDRQVVTFEGATTTAITLRHGVESLVGEVTETEFVSGAGGDRAPQVDRQATTRTETYPNVSPLLGELAVGGVLNFGNTPWTPAANTLRAELFTQGLALGRGSGGETGWRLEAVINPFGEEQRPAYGYDPSGNLTALYKTEPLVDEFGEPVIALVADASGGSLPIVTHQFITDEAGDRIPLTVGTGRAIGPGIYLRIEDAFSGQTSPSVIGGLKFDL